MDDRSLPEQTHHAIAQLESVLSPLEEWPVFLTLHRLTLYQNTREQLSEQAINDVEEALDGPILRVYREHGLVPPTVRTDGARRIMKRLCESAEIEPSTGDYLQPHGGRRAPAK